MADSPRYSRPGEEPGDRLDRQLNELLQELRLAQGGTQILFAFLLGIAFQTRFQEADTFIHTVYAATLIAAALSVGLFVAPVSFHRIIYRRQLRHRMLPIASRMAIAGLLLAVLAVAGGLLIALDVILPRTAAILTVAAILFWFGIFWFGIPAWVRRTSGGEE
ncbi:DUF6328 family protein [Kribbella sp. NPDC004875]|uniref:DUF6328 family protein n=1 Tax=Kribbella sp. NPDC004875 TaxID=3364107 RepID=UPI003691C620